MKTILVTGGCGFIGSHFIHKLLSLKNYNVVNVDKMNYCANLKNISYKYNFDEHKANLVDLCNYKFYHVDINDKPSIMKILVENQISIVYHFAAQTHVDRSYDDPNQFIIDNIQATNVLLDCCVQYGSLEKFIYVSTDEVYGEVLPDNDLIVLKYNLLAPTNPYSVSKASAELLVQSYYKSYGLPIIITRSNNVYGPHQYIEKVIPKFIYLLYHDKSCTIFGQGSALRKYLYIDDACDAYLTIMINGAIGKIYEMGSNDEYNTKDIANKIISIMKPNMDTNNRWLSFVSDRKFNDARYIINAVTMASLGWIPKISFEKGLLNTVEWYVNYAIPSKYFK